MACAANTTLHELCRREGIAESLCYTWSKEFLETGKRLPIASIPRGSYHQMLYLGDVFEGWAQGKNVSRKNCANYLGYAEAMRKLADEVGRDWHPPEPRTLDILGRMAR
jgi:hypothetical protein